MRKLFVVAMGSVVTLVAFAGMANASATLDLIWIDVTDSTCTNDNRRDCPEIGSAISSVYTSDDITLKVMVTAGPKGYLGGQMSVDYSDAVPKLSVIGFRRLLTTFPEYYLPADFTSNGVNDTGARIEKMQTTAVDIVGTGIGLPAGQTAYVGTVAFHKDALLNGTFEISVDTLGTGDGLGNLEYQEISATATYNSAFLVNAANDTCIIDKKCSVGGGEPRDSCTANPGDEVTYTYEFVSGCGLVIDDKLGVIGESGRGTTLSRTTTLIETTTNLAYFESTECVCIISHSDSVTVTVAAPTATPSATPAPTPTAIPTPMPSKKLNVCHKGQNSISVPANAVRAHLAHGDARGVCP